MGIEATTHQSRRRQFLWIVRRPFCGKDAGPPLSYLAGVGKRSMGILWRRDITTVYVLGGYIYSYVCCNEEEEKRNISLFPPISAVPPTRSAGSLRVFRRKKKKGDRCFTSSFIFPLLTKKKNVRNLHPKKKKRIELDYKLCGAKNVIAAPNRPLCIYSTRSAGCHWQMSTQIIRVRREGTKKKKKRAVSQFLLISFRPRVPHSRFVGFGQFGLMWTQ